MGPEFLPLPAPHCVPGGWKLAPPAPRETSPFSSGPPCGVGLGARSPPCASFCWPVTSTFSDHLSTQTECPTMRSPTIWRETLIVPSK